MLYTAVDVTFGSVASRMLWSKRGSGVNHKPSGELLPDRTSQQQRIGQRFSYTSKDLAMYTVQWLTAAWGRMDLDTYDRRPQCEEIPKHQRRNHASSMGRSAIQSH